MPDTPLQTLLKILELEQRQNYQDRSVIGGIEGFLKTNSSLWSSYSDLNADAELQSLLSFPYSNASFAKRQLWVSTITGKIIKQNTPKPINITPPKRTAAPRKKNVNKSTSIESLFQPVTVLKGVDSKTQERLNKIGIANVWDLLFNPPRALIDYSLSLPVNEVKPGVPCTIEGEVWSSKTLRLGSKGRLLVGEIVLGDSTGTMRCLWFGNRFITKTLTPGNTIRISGKPEIYRGALVFQSPEYEFSNASTTNKHTGRILPVYRLTRGLTAKKLRGLSWDTIFRFQQLIPTSHMPTNFYTSNNLLPLDASVSQLHFPDSWESHEQARRTLGLEELVHLQLALTIKQQNQKTPKHVRPIQVPQEFLRLFRQSLPFQLTSSQVNCIDEILADMRRLDRPMTRLLQGDVGSGKTVVIGAAILSAISAGFQSALMAPTEILAEQHYLTFQSLIDPEMQGHQTLQPIITLNSPILPDPIQIGLLTGSTTPAQKAKIYEAALNGSLHLLIGTQSLINQDLKFAKLNLAVTDEQHRFGVLQRADLKDPDATPPHSLTMSATPIPRTLSLSIYGDLDISTINQLPAGRRPVRTRSISSDKTPVAYGFLKKQLLAGHQGFVVCPAIDQTTDLEQISVTQVFDQVSQEFQGHTVALLHGRLSAKKKEEVMDQFRKGQIEILVSTSVIEVGVDVPNANIMLIHGADRFGLSQLHQFRGRVGRGGTQSYCVLISTDPSEAAIARLNALEQTTDGFLLAEQDLRLRGPGDYFGTRQSGMPSLKIANVFDYTLMELARQTATTILAEDPGLELPQNIHLKQNVALLLDQIVHETS
tara:strand:+ start:17583 stop:20045 length:2463 start_codon:yes stop_codon:yes gene_type:complete